MRPIVLAAAGAIAILIAGTFAFVTYLAPSDRFAQCRATSVAGGAIGGPFELVDETGATVTDTDLIDGPTLLYFGYTFCPDVCPIDNMRNGQAVAILDEQGLEVTPVFITVDPERDDVETVRRYADNFHERMVGLTGSVEQTDAAARAYRVYYDLRDEEDSDFYLVDHTTLTYLVFPEEGVVEFYRNDLPAEEMAASLTCFLEAAS